MNRGRRPSPCLRTSVGSHRNLYNATIAAGSTVALLGLFASPINGASMNRGDRRAADKEEREAA
jgi:hypothetical protein